MSSSCFSSTAINNLLGQGLGFTIYGYTKAILANVLYEGQNHPIYKPWVCEVVGIIPWSSRMSNIQTLEVIIKNSCSYEIHIFRKLSDVTFHLTTQEAHDWIEHNFIPTCKEMFKLLLQSLVIINSKLIIYIK
jgi:hypothetical protein